MALFAARITDHRGTGMTVKKLSSCRLLRQTGSIVLVLGLALGTAGSVSALTLKEVVQKTILSHPEIGAIRNNRKAISQELRAARGAYLPSIDLRGAVGHEFSNNATTRGRAARRNGNKSGWVSMNRYEAGVNLRQLVFDGFGTDKEVERQIGRVQSAKYRVADTVNAVALRAIEAYLEVQRTRQIVNIARRNVRTHEQILSRVSARVRGGRGARSDVDQATARVSATKVALASARGRYEDAVASYRAVVGEEPRDLQPVTAPELELPPNVDDAVAYAIEHAPSIMAAAADARSARANVGVASSRFLPRVDLELSANYLYNADGTRGPNRDFSALLVGRWNIYRGGIDLARKREAVARMFEARDVVERSRREVAQQTRISWNALNSARERLISVRRQLAANSRVRIAYSRQFDRGRRTLLDLLDIQNEIFTNETSRITEQFTVIFGAYRTLATMGKILPVLGLKMPVEGTREPAKNFFNGLRDELPITRRDIRFQ